jgi:flagellar hook-associated protein 3 FlgL
MRITDRILQNNFLINMNENKKRLEKLQRQIETHQKILYPSDDPHATGKILRLQNQIQDNEVYIKNIDNTLGFVQASEDVLRAIHDDIQRFLEWVPDLTNPNYFQQHQNFAKKIDLLISSLIDSSNKQYDGKYILGGTDFATKPYGFADTGDPNIRRVEIKTSSVAGEQTIRISSSLTQKVNITGEELFGDLDGNDVFNTLIRISNTLKNGAPPSLDDIRIIENFEKHLLNKISDLGNIANQLSFTRETLYTINQELRSLLSDEKDTDVAAAMIELQGYQFNLDVSYKVASMIIPNSLVNYL